METHCRCLLKKWVGLRALAGETGGNTVLSCPIHPTYPTSLHASIYVFHVCIVYLATLEQSLGGSSPQVHKPKLPVRIKETVAVDLSFDCIEGWRLLGASHDDGVLCFEIHVHVYI